MSDMKLLLESPFCLSDGASGGTSLVADAGNLCSVARRVSQGHIQTVLMLLKKQHLPPATFPDLSSTAVSRLASSPHLDLSWIR